MGELEQLDQVFHRLLFDSELRAQLRAGDWSGVGDMKDAFGAIDMDELDKLAVAIRDGLVRGSLGGLGIGDAFPDTLASLGDERDGVMDRFLAATGAACVDGRPCDGTGRREGVSVLEAFHGWAVRELAASPQARCRAQHELAAALLGALTRTPRAGFLVAWPLVHVGPGAWVCVLDAQRPLAGPHEEPEEPVVYVSISGRYATGRLSPVLAALVLERVDDPPPWAFVHLAGLEPSALARVRQALVEKGLA